MTQKIKRQAHDILDLFGISYANKGFDILQAGNTAFSGGYVTSIDASGVFTFADDADDATANVEDGLVNGTSIVIEYANGKGPAVQGNNNDLILRGQTYTVAAISGTSVPVDEISSASAEPFPSNSVRWRLSSHDRWMAIVSLAKLLGVVHFVKARSLYGDHLTIDGADGSAGIGLAHNIPVTGTFDKVTNSDATHSLQLIRG